MKTKERRAQMAKFNAVSIKPEKKSILENLRSFSQIVVKDFRRNKYLYIMVAPVVAFYIIFHYLPMYGAQIAFRNFSPSLGIFDSPWVGLEHVINFVESHYFWRLIRNGLLLNLYEIIFGFPAPIILALLINELRNSAFKRISQTIVYLPHFISLVVVAGLVREFVSLEGLINDILVLIGMERTVILQIPELFRPVFITSLVWQSMGWGSIIFLAALSGIDPQLYEAATLDGCGRFKKILYITLPGIMPTIVILLILRMGSMFDVGFERIILLYNPLTFETADVIGSFVFRRGLLEFNWSYSAAVGLFNSVINFAMILMANWLSRRVNETSLW